MRAVFNAIKYIYLFIKL